MSKPEKPVEPTVCAVRYCMSCGKPVLATALGVVEAVGMRAVGASLSVCCSAHTALLLLPVDGGAKTAGFPAALPEIVGAVAAQAPPLPPRRKAR